MLGGTQTRVKTGQRHLAGSLLALVYAACGGLMATTFSRFAQGKAAAWLTGGNCGGGVIGAAFVLWLAQRASLPVIGIAMARAHASAGVARLYNFRTAARIVLWFQGRFTEMRRECLAVLRSPRRRWGFLLLLAPACTCAAQPLLPAFASHFGVNANGVLWINGVAGGAVLAAGSLLGILVPGDWDRCLTYVGAGVTNAIGAMVLLAPNRPSFYFAGTLIYLLSSGFCQARAVALVMDVVGRDIGDASTWFSALTAITNIPIAFMIWLEGRMFRDFGIHGLLWTDAAGNLIVFTIVAAVFLTK